MSSSNLVAPDSRAFVTDKSYFGNVQRTNVLGLSYAPEITLDSTVTVAYFGANSTSQIVNAATGLNGNGETFPLPLDVKMIGYEYLSQMGVSATQQEAMLAAWLALPPEVSKQYTDDWEALDKTDVSSITAFVSGLMALLSQ